MLHLLRPLPNGFAQKQFATGRELRRIQWVADAPLVGDGEVAELLDLVAEELDAHGMLGDRREDVEDAAANRELAAAGDHIDARVCEVDELAPDGGEVVAAATCGEADRLEVGEVVGERLECGAHGGDEDDGLVRGVRGLASLPRLELAQRVDALPDRLRTRAQAFVRQRLPGRELDDVGIRHARECGGESLGLTAGSGDREQHLRTTAALEESGEKRRA